MTVTTDSPAAEQTAAIGRVARVIGPVVDVEFAPDEMPDLNNALQLDIETDEGTRLLDAAVAVATGA